MTSASKPNWSIRRPTADSRIVATFRGRIEATDGRESVHAMLVAMRGDTIDLVFDMRLVESYEPEARQAWQEALLPHKGQLRSISLVTEAKIPRMGVSVLALNLGLNCVMLDTLPDDLGG